LVDPPEGILTNFCTRPGAKLALDVWWYNSNISISAVKIWATEVEKDFEDQGGTD